MSGGIRICLASSPAEEACESVHKGLNGFVLCRWADGDEWQSETPNLVLDLASHDCAAVPESGPVDEVAHCIGDKPVDALALCKRPAGKAGTRKADKLIGGKSSQSKLVYSREYRLHLRQGATKIQAAAAGRVAVAAL